MIAGCVGSSDDHRPDTHGDCGGDVPQTGAPTDTRHR